MQDSLIRTCSDDKLSMSEDISRRCLLPDIIREHHSAGTVQQACAKLLCKLFNADTNRDIACFTD